MTRCTLGSAFVSVMLIACGPSLGHEEGGHDGESEDDGVDPFAVERACEAYDGRETIDACEVEVRIVNRRPEPIYLTGACGRSAGFELEGTLGGRVVRSSADERLACSGWTGQARPCLGCSSLCQPRRIEPGGVFVGQWNGIVAAEVDLPAHCSITEEPVSCLAPTALGPGRFEVRAQAGASEDCEGPCECEPDALGSCLVDAWLREVSLLADAAYDGVCERIELAFEP